ncbi:MAG TPA: hypothetical protein VGK99_23610, partial [Acidobacteriota bacterium]
MIGFKPETIEARKKAYAEAGWKGYWRKELEMTEEWGRQKGNYVTPYSFARTCARLGEKDRALKWLERAYAEHSDHLVLLKVDLQPQPCLQERDAYICRLPIGHSAFTAESPRSPRSRRVAVQPLRNLSV